MYVALQIIITANTPLSLSNSVSGSGSSESRDIQSSTNSAQRARSNRRQTDSIDTQGLGGPRHRLLLQKANEILGLAEGSSDSELKSLVYNLPHLVEHLTALDGETGCHDNTASEGNHAYVFARRCKVFYKGRGTYSVGLPLHQAIEDVAG
jgi:hypothetical protein